MEKSKKSEDCNNQFWKWWHLGNFKFSHGHVKFLIAIFIESWKSVTRTWNEFEELRNRIYKVEHLKRGRDNLEEKGGANLRYAKQQQGFTKMSENSYNPQQHSSPVTIGITDENFRWISIEWVKCDGSGQKWEKDAKWEWVIPIILTIQAVDLKCLVSWRFTDNRICRRTWITLKIATLAPITIPCPASTPLIPAIILIAFVQKMPTIPM